MSQITVVLRSVVRQFFGDQLRRTVLAALPFVSLLLTNGHAAEPPAPPLEVSGYSRISTPAEISDYLNELAKAYPQGRVEIFGTSVEGRPLNALLMTSAPGADVTKDDRLTVQIIGSQHATESASAEALLFVARELLAGKLQDLLEDIDVVLVADANPDGRANKRRVNANGVNINTDFVTLTQPESRALISALHRYRPEVMLDVHESAVLKRESLALEGYMTNFSAQFEMANNPNIVPSLRRFAMEEVLVPWIADVNAAGLHSHRYFGEIKSTRQPITNGGLTLNNLRNRAGIEGPLSLLMETRLDPKGPEYPTFRNIGPRVERQRTSIEKLLTLVHGKRSRILAEVAAARQQAASAPLVLDVQYAPGLGNPRVTIELQRIDDGKLEKVEFADHRTITAAEPMPMPAAYVVPAQYEQIGELLDRHGIDFHSVGKERTDWAVEFEAAAVASTPDATLNTVRERPVRLRARAGDLWIDLDQPRGRLAAMLLEPRSDSSLLLKPQYFPLVEAGKALPIYRVTR